MLQAAGVISEKAMYGEMLRIRRIEEAIAARYTEGKMRCPVHLSIGQEATAVGVAQTLNPEDLMMSTHRAHAHYLAKGGSLKRMIAELYGKVTGCTRGKGGSMHLLDLEVRFFGSTPIVGSSFPVAVGTALASKMRGENRITCVYMGEGMAEEGVFSEALNFAALKQLPVLFVCEDNLYSVYSGLSVRQPAGRKQSSIAEAHQVPSLRGDGNKVDEVYEIASEAVERIRSGAGPQFLEFATYRWREHCGPNYDNHIGYRTEPEFLMWKERCPLRYTKNRLQVDDDVLLTAIDAEIAEAFAFAEESPFPDPSESEAHLYA